MFDERSRVNDMHKRVTSAIRVLLNAAKYSAGVDERNTIEQLREGKPVTPNFEGIDDSKRKFVRDFVKTNLGAIDGTKFAYVRVHTIMQDGVKQREYTSVLDDIKVDDTEVLPWSPSQIMEPWNREQFNHFVDKYLIEVKGFEYEEMEKDILLSLIHI